jgi:hypothetical protein
MKFDQFFEEKKVVIELMDLSIIFIYLSFLSKVFNLISKIVNIIGL